MRYWSSGSVGVFTILWSAPAILPYVASATIALPNVGARRGPFFIYIGIVILVALAMDAVYLQMITSPLSYLDYGALSLIQAVVYMAAATCLLDREEESGSD
jgi:hypothetical protein